MDSPLLVDIVAYYNKLNSTQLTLAQFLCDPHLLVPTCVDYGIYLATRRPSEKRVTGSRPTKSTHQVLTELIHDVESSLRQKQYAGYGGSDASGPPERPKEL